MKWFSIYILSFVTFSYCMQIMHKDRLIVFGMADGVIRIDDASGNKTWQSGTVGLQIEHHINNAISLTSGIECGTYPQVARLQQMSIDFNKEHLTFSAGYFHNRIGYTSTWYGIQNRLQNGTIWDANGIGYTVGFTNGNIVIDHSTLINSRENGSSDVFVGLHIYDINVGINAGFQSYDIEHQDNLVSGGGTFSYSKLGFTISDAACWTKYLGYGNCTVIPGKSFSNITDVILKTDNFAVYDQLRYEFFKKTYSHYLLNNSIHPALILFKKYSIGPGIFVATDDNVFTYAPFIGFIANPIHQNIIALRALYETVGQSVPVTRFEGSVCIAF